MILIPRDVGGTLEWYAPLRPAAGPTVRVQNADGGDIVAAATAATLDTVATTLSAGAASGATSLSVTAAAGIVVNRRYLLSLTGTQSEFIEVKAISGTTVTLKYPLAYDHANASAFEGTRISYALAGAVTTLEEDYCRATFSWSVGAAVQTPGIVEFTITRHPVLNPAALPDLFAVEPMLRRKLAGDTDLTDVLARAWDEVLDRLWAMGTRPGAIVGAGKVKRAVVYHALALCSEQYGREFRDEQEFWATRALGTLDAFKVIGAIDEDEDDAVETHEQGVFGGELYRA